MKLKSLLLFCFVLTATCSFAQQERYNNDDHRPMRHDNDRDASVLSVFSENGEQFFLVLNGVSQNNAPVSKIRVEGLPQYGNDIQILFADRRTPEINKRINITDPVDGRAVNMTLKIVRDREGYAKLKFHKCVEVDHQYRPEANEYVMNYGQPQQVTTSVTANGYAQAPPPPPPPAPVGMDPQTFSDAKQSISNASFEDTKLSTAKTILASNYISTDQVMEICGLFAFENTKLTFAKFAYSKTVDRNNYYKVGSVFDFDSDKEALNKFISNGGR